MIIFLLRDFIQISDNIPFSQIFGFTEVAIVSL